VEQPVGADGRSKENRHYNRELAAKVTQSYGVDIAAFNYVVWDGESKYNGALPL
jgi:hypothetical protein